MARIRSVKPELRTDLIVASWPREVRYAWVLLWGYCDDQGRGVDDLRLLTSDLFPLDRDVTERKFARWLQLFTDSGRICHYEADGHRFFHVINWHHQRINRPTPSRLPPCPTHGGPDERGARNHPRDSRNGSVNGSRSDSLHDSPPTRAPAEQGAGSRDKEQGAGSVEHANSHALAHPAVVVSLLDRTGPYVGKIRGQLAGHLDQLVAEGVPPDALEAALTEWQTRDRAAPGLLPGLVQDQLRRATGTRNTRPSASDAAAQAALDAAARVAARRQASA